ncbi:DUF445 domain-containing protein [Bacillus marinisedimentorum]|uniref:DUF445 domain-containing protein n=1 Tax=Bacillus marinisedimentorum TaxID=1821260 RepID=UPI0007DF0179|nr:DUF445 family protein [Bacillus marinisedimentorum]
MSEFIIILIMIAVGAAIGGVTNSLAIKMLFRPYKPLYLFNRRLPFTPGLIPKRREELAKQLGRMVVDYLLTPEGIRKKFLDKGFRYEVEQWAKDEARRVLDTEKTIEESLAALGTPNAAVQGEEKLRAIVEERYQRWMEANGDRKLENVLPEAWKDRADERIPVMTDHIIGKIKEYFSGDEGKKIISRMVDDFFESRGTLMNMVQMFMGSESLTGKVQPELIKMLSQDRTKKTLQNLLESEWDSVKALKVHEVAEKAGGDEKITAFLQQAAIEQVQIGSLLSIPIKDLAFPYRQLVIETWVPKMLAFAGDFAAVELERLMKKLHLADVVREQVESFPVEHLEQMVLSISRREFKLITVLGAVLGGVIGAVQGVAVILIG